MPAAVAEHARDAQRLIKHFGGHQFPPAGPVAGELLVGFPLGVGIAEQPVGHPGPLVGLPVDARGVQAAQVLFRGQHR